MININIIKHLLEEGRRERAIKLAAECILEDRVPEKQAEVFNMFDSQEDKERLGLMLKIGTLKMAVGM